MNSDVFSASRNFKSVVILRSGVCALRLVCLQDIKNAKHVYHSVHMPLLSVIRSGLPKLGHMP